VAYKSSYGESGFNVALFDLASADLVNCILYRVKDVSITKQEADSRYFIKEPPSGGGNNHSTRRYRSRWRQGAGC